MKVFNKLLIFLYILVILVVSVGIVVSLWFPDVADNIIAQFSIAQESLTIKLVLSLVAAIVVFLSIEIIYYGLSNDQPENILVKATENGEVRVSLQSIEQMALKISRSVEGIREVKIKAKNLKGTLNFNVIVAVLPKSLITEVTENVQKAIKSEVELITSIQVGNIEVFVDNNIVKNK